MRRTRPLIVGGGPAGATAALLLARGGAAPILLERSRETGDALCGGFLSWRTLAALDRLGIPREALNPCPIDRVRILAGGRSATARLPGTACAVSRRRLDTVLAAHASAAGAGIERGVAARMLDAEGLRLDDGAVERPEHLFLATGKHDLRGARRDADPGLDPAIGLRVRVAPGPAIRRRLDNMIELHCFAGGYAGVAMQEDGSVNLCMAVRRSRLVGAGGPAALLGTLGREMPELGELVARMECDAAIDAVANVPYGWRAAASVPGLYRLGDQAAVIPSLAGEGIGIAVASAVAAVDHWQRRGSSDAGRWQAGFAAIARGPIRRADMLYRMAERPLGARMLVMATRLAPALTETAARLTRISRFEIDAPAAAPHIRP